VPDQFIIKNLGNSGYVVSNDGSACTSAPSVPLENCRILAAGGSTCAECLPGYEASRNNDACTDPGATTCLLNCAAGWWNDHQGSTDALLQRCVSDNCAVAEDADRTQCTQCWVKSDMDVYATWGGRGSYTPAEILAAADPPFHFSSQACQIQCQTGFWSNWGTGAPLIAAINSTLDQRCTSNNCKTMDSSQDPKWCLSCWEELDVNPYGSWFGKGSYLPAETEGRDTAAPFLLDPVTHTCGLQCATGYWTNKGTDYINTTDWQWHQRCTSDNCKTFDTAKSPKWCLTCWIESDIDPYGSWLGKGSYLPTETVARDTSVPFLLDSATGICGLQCAATYWTNKGTD
jgi:hypothetical protein